ncbi:hypothetical protein GIB67_012683 [Kingdonia uniflora]|uniref:KIB1-4 beta-propeller domain-containing protein n=1 Tax=Kingdonia uniflora TaxID=39325 RepID=A0A7J7NF21_9MAGN|nr:hypothetical protein GIB67_012683 [Kingdonia uniflora]
MGGRFGWANLPDDLLECFIKRFTNAKDLIRVGAVCVSWNSYITRNRNHLLPQFPLQPPGLTYCVSDDKYCVSSTRGWLVIVEKTDLSLHLYNPFVLDNNKIDLPPLSTFRRADPHEQSHNMFLQKVVISTDGTSNSVYAVMAIYNCNRGNKVAFYRPGGKFRWNSLTTRHDGVFDIIYFRDQFYLAHKNGMVTVASFRRTSPDFHLLIPNFPCKGLQKIYLVESLGQLLQLRAYKRNRIYFTDDINLYTPVGPHDMGVFNFKKAKIEEPNPLKKFQDIMPPPVWVQPMPQQCCKVSYMESLPYFF